MRFTTRIASLRLLYIISSHIRDCVVLENIGYKKMKVQKWNTNCSSPGPGHEWIDSAGQDRTNDEWRTCNENASNLMDISCRSQATTMATVCLWQRKSGRAETNGTKTRTLENEFELFILYAIPVSDEFIFGFYNQSIPSFSLLLYLCMYRTHHTVNNLSNHPENFIYKRLYLLFLLSTCNHRIDFLDSFY